MISVFVSRIDRALDEDLKQKGIQTALSGIYNSAAIYSSIEQMGVSGCRILFASTGVKGDDLKADYYIEKLLAFNSVNTAPVETIMAFTSNKTTSNALPIKREIIEAHFAKLQDAGINFEALLDEQISDGLQSFKEAFQEIMEAV